MLVTFVFAAAMSLSPVAGYAKANTAAQRARPNHGATEHSQSHGGKYRGALGSAHKGGHYSNPRTGDQYGRHKTK